MNFPCESCKKIIPIKINSKEFNEFRDGWSFQCPICKENVNVARYVFFENYKEKRKNLKIVK
ncbi:MAG: hypothetical protein VB130_00715 [Clostridium sp.]|nr:hypothetical protein [Clostridium sp.]